MIKFVLRCSKGEQHVQDEITVEQFVSLCALVHVYIEEQ